MGIKELRQLVVLVVVMIVAELHAHPDGYYRRSEHTSSADFDEVKQLLMALEDDKKQLFKDLAVIQTTCSAAEDNTDVLLNNIIPYLELKNPLQDNFIQVLADQAKEIRHKMDKALSSAKETMTVAKSVSDNVDEQVVAVLGPRVALGNALQEDLINELMPKVDTLKTSLLSTLDDSVIFLDAVVETQLNRSVDLNNFIYTRKCENGFANFEEGDTDIVFETTFEDVPAVTLHIVGFNSHLDVDTDSHHHSRHGTKNPLDVLALDKFIVYQNTTGFGVRVLDVSVGSVDLKSVYCSWSACQHIDLNVQVSID